jgi:hypothetical protein
MVNDPCLVEMTGAAAFLGNTDEPVSSTRGGQARASAVDRAAHGGYVCREWRWCPPDEPMTETLTKPVAAIDLDGLSEV